MAHCRVRFEDAEGIHSIEVTADTLFEAVAQAVVEFREDKHLVRMPAPETDFTVIVLHKPAEHVIRLSKIHDWAKPSTKGGPAEMLRRERVRKMLLANSS